MRVIVIEPHVDDAFLSVGWHLETIWKQEEKIIITVFGDTKRDKEAVAYADAVGASSMQLSLQETPMGAPFQKRKIPEIQQVLTTIKADDLVDVILFPVGLQHPDHINVAISRSPNCLRYVDTPYQTKLKLAEELRTKTKGMALESMCFPPKRKWRHIPLFKSQSMFFHYNPMVEQECPEIILR